MPRIVRSHDVRLDEEYSEWMREIKRRFRGAQSRAAVKVNSEQLLFNWQLGRDLVLRKAEERWGSGIVEQVSLDLKSEFPGVKGFSARNLWDMKRWYLFYAEDDRAGRLLEEMEEGLELGGPKLRQVAAVTLDDVDGEILRQSVAELGFPTAFGFVPWGHHIAIVRGCDTVEEALFYVRKTIEEGLSREGLADCMRADLFRSSGRALTNFAEHLPESQARLAQEIVKDTYDFGFMSLARGYDERELEAALERNITRFLLELGKGFAFVGRQMEVVVSGKTRRVDMLFYHIRLRCYVVLELKARPFEPEYAGKLNFYVNAIDELVKTPEENPTIGLLICKDKDQTEVQWAFRGISTPMGVATYGNVRIEDIQRHLPTDEQIRQRVEQAEREFRESAEGD